MSEIKTLSIAEMGELSAHDVARQILDAHPEKDFINIAKDLNYYNSALKNVTKNPNEALEVLRQTISETRHVLFRSGDANRVKDIFNELNRIRHVDVIRAKEVMDSIESEGDLGKLFAFVVSKDMSMGVVIQVPENVKS